MKTFTIKSAIMLILFLAFPSCSSDSNSEANCVKISCLNGGSFVNCGCQCPDGFGGSDCSTKLTPARVKITKIIVKTFPNLDSGSNWDFGSSADLYVNIENSNEIIFTSSTYYLNAIADGVNYFNFDVQPILNISNVTSPHYLSLWDYDGNDTPPSSDEFIGYIAFYPYNSLYGFPEKLTISNIEAGLIAELQLKYEW